MQLTQEQQAIIQTAGNLKINAVAGSGKTTTLLEYAKKRPFKERILYLAFNKSVKLEAIKKFSQAAVENVTIETAHSLAYAYTMRGGKYMLVNGYKSHQIKDMLNLKPVSEETNSEYILANHALNFSKYFCSQTTEKVQELDYLSLFSQGTEAHQFVKKYYEDITQATRLLLAKMQRAEIGITHDFYLKKFQLFNPQLPFDTILLDEGQDASSVMLDIFLKQEQATKVVVGDIHQQIYAWRFAINALQSIDFKSFSLSHSFRFAEDIAFLAQHYLKWKKIVNPNYEDSPIYGVGGSSAVKLKATLARRNLTLLKKAIEWLSEKNAHKIYFEGNLNAYTYASESASIYDVLNLYLGKKQAIKDVLIKQMPNLFALEEYAEKTEDIELQMLIEMVKEYKHELPYWLNQIRSRQVEDNQREEADMIFSTVHRCKGLEYDEVFLADDFITEGDIKKMMLDQALSEGAKAKINEEINILYVAATRTRNQLYLPKKYLPTSPEMTFKNIQAEQNNAEEQENKGLKNTYRSKTSKMT